MNKELNKFPEQWELSNLSEIGEINGITINPSKEFHDAEFTYIDIDSIENETGRIKHTKKYTGFDAPSRARRVVKYNDVIMSTVRPYLKAFAVIPKEHENHICSTGFAVLSPYENINSKYLLYVLFSRYVINQCKKMMVGAQYPALNESEVKQIKIPLPPLPEQKKIAEILSTVDLAIEKLNKAIRKLDRLKKELIRKLLTEGIENHIQRKTAIGKIPQSWHISKLGILGELQYGYTCSASAENTGIKFLRITDIKSDGKIHWDSVPYCHINDKEFNKYSIKKEDILFARIGASTGKTTIVDLNTRGVFASYLIRFVRKVDNIDSKYLFYFTQSRKYWTQVNRYKEGQLKKGLNARILGNIVIPIPSIQEQKMISEFLNSLDCRLELLSKRKERMQLIKKGLMNDLLTGRKRVRLES